MSLSIGIVGLPNVGKSTLFKLLTSKAVDIANYPFTTIEPNVGVVAIPDERLERLAELLKPGKIIPASIEFVDIAGLVKGAHKGEGLGNKFLHTIREVDAIVHVVRGFKDAQVSHVTGVPNTEEDIETVEMELALADLATVQRRLEEIRPKAQSGDEASQDILPILEKVERHLASGKQVRALAIPEEERTPLRDLNMLTGKPVLYLFNVDDQAPKPSRTPSVSLNLKLELELSELPVSEATAMRKELGLPAEAGLDRLIKESFELLHQITFYTAEHDILQAWVASSGIKAPQAAGLIHTDFERGFVKAEVISAEELLTAGSEAAAREQGKVRTEGKDSIVQDGDVVRFRFNP